MPEPVQITQVTNRAIVRLHSWTLSEGGPTTSQPSLTQVSQTVASAVPPGLGGQVRVLNIAPGDSYMMSDTLAGPQLCDRLRLHLEGREMAAVDLSCALKILRVEGVAARELLSKGCGLDLHPRSFPAGRATRTRFAQLAVILDCTDPTPRFDLYTGRSYLAYLHEWLVDAAVEFSPSDTSHG